MTFSLQFIVAKSRIKYENLNIWTFLLEKQLIFYIPSERKKGFQNLKGTIKKGLNFCPLRWCKIDVSKLNFIVSKTIKTIFRRWLILRLAECVCHQSTNSKFKEKNILICKNGAILYLRKISKNTFYIYCIRSRER